MGTIDDEALCAASDNVYANGFIERYQQFILRAASKYTHRYITQSDDEWMVALEAFSEAISAYRKDKGGFLPFAEMVIRHRLTDYVRSESKFACEVKVDPCVFSGDAGDEAEQDLSLRKNILKNTAQEEEHSVKLEIEAVGELLDYYGFAFSDLISCSPKAIKTRKFCAAVIRLLIGSPVLLGEMRTSKSLPIKFLGEKTGIHRKILERHRKYIIAAVEILDGDFPCLSEYFYFVREGANR